MKPESPNDLLVAHYNEVALKLGHRKIFVARLADNIRRSVDDLDCGPIRAHAARILIEIGAADEAELVRRVRWQPGVANCLPMRRVDRDRDAIDRAVEDLLEVWRPSGSFAVDVRRADKTYPEPSPQMAGRLGARIQQVSRARVDLGDPDERVHVLIVQDAAFLGVRRVDGCGGLPVSTGGRVMLLLSGGIDSPVAGLRMQRRGCRLEAVHFHSVPYLSAASQDKARSLAAVLARGQRNLALHMVAFGDAQSEVVRSVPRPLRVVLYRRLMVRIASALARRHRCTALVTGESLGQVASQTLANMTVIGDASSLPVLRPLVGMEKLEITRYAQAAETFEISILPDQDCCTLFVPRHPATAARGAEVAEAEARLDVDRLVRDAVAAAHSELVEPSW